MNERIKLLRQKLNLTQTEFAQKIGLQANTIATYEMGVRNPRDSNILIICREFSVNEEWLRKGSGEMFLNSEENTNFKERIIGAVTVMDEFTAKEVWNFIKNIS